MNKLWNQRLTQYQNHLLRYLKYVFNDHFIIALFFIFGALCYGYSILLNKYLVAPTLENRLLVVGALYIGLQIGRFATLLQRPDIVFLLPTDYQINDYLKKALHHGMIVATLTQTVITLAIVPLMVRTLYFSVGAWILVLCDQVILKWNDLLICKISLFNSQWYCSKAKYFLKWLIPLIIILIAIFIAPGIAFLATLLFSVVLYFSHSKLEQNHSFKWNFAIELEEKRMYRLYKIFSLFTDVSEIKQNIKRRSYLDHLLPQYKNKSAQSYLYLYWRGFIRDTEYSGLFLRLTIISVLLIICIKLNWLAVSLGILFVYLTGFQLLPLFSRYYDNVFIHLYPVSFNIQKQDFKKVLHQLMFLQSIIIAFAILGGTHSIISMVIFGGLACIVIMILSGKYFDNKATQLLDSFS